MKTINAFLKGKWMRLAKYAITHPQQMKATLQKLSQMTQRQGLEEVKDKLLLMGAYLKAIASGTYKDYNKEKLLLVVAACIYVISPLDLIPDFLVGIGFADDITIVIWAFSQLKDELHRFENNHQLPQH